jgi:hypothetical protein
LSIDNRQSTTSNHQSAINNQQSSIGNQQSVIGNPLIPFTCSVKMQGSGLSPLRGGDD